MAAAEGRHQRKQRAERKEHDASHHRHVITRDRKHVGETRYIHGLVHRRLPLTAYPSLPTVADDCRHVTKTQILPLFLIAACFPPFSALYHSFAYPLLAQEVVLTHGH